MTDIIPAFCVGLTQVSVGHPFDTTKVLMQNNKKVGKIVHTST